MSEADPAAAVTGPPGYHLVGRHAVFPDVSSEEASRLNFLAHMNRHLATRVVPLVKDAWEHKVEPRFVAEHGRKPETRHEVRHALSDEPVYQTWSALRRMTMEQRQQAGRWTAIRQAEELAAGVAALTAGDDRLRLDASTTVPRYIGKVDHHLMPGSYHRELFAGDVSAAANYDHAIFATTGGLLGRYSDGGGRAVAQWISRRMPDFQPAIILDLGATLGHNTLPIAAAFPSAEVIAIDVAAPMLRYGLARAKALGVDNVRFVQADATMLADVADASVDWVQTTMVLHELSLPAMRSLFRQCFRVLRPGGLMLHIEQPQYTPAMPLFDQAMRDWDAFYNNEPFWSTLHEIDLDAQIVEAGFGADRLLHDTVTAVVERDLFPDAADDDAEDFGRKPAWRAIGAIR